MDISKQKKDIIFVLWGKHALKKKDIIDNDSHKFTISSHPSGLSCRSKMGNYPSFNDCDILV